MTPEGHQGCSCFAAVAAGSPLRTNVVGVWTVVDCACCWLLLFRLLFFYGGQCHTQVYCLLLFLRLFLRLLLSCAQSGLCSLSCCCALPAVVASADFEEAHATLNDDPTDPGCWLRSLLQFPPAQEQDGTILPAAETAAVAVRTCWSTVPQAHPWWPLSLSPPADLTRPMPHSTITPLTPVEAPHGVSWPRRSGLSASAASDGRVLPSASACCICTRALCNAAL